MAVLDSLQEIKSVLDDILPVALDARDINPPGAYLTATRVQNFYLDGSLDLEAKVYIIAPDIGAADSLALLDTLLLPVIDALVTNGYEISDTSLAETIGLPDGSNGLPAYSLTITTT